MLKLLAWSDSPLVDTGFGRVAREVLKSLYSTGDYQITSIGINYFGMTPNKDDLSGSGIDKIEAFHNYDHIPAGIGKDRDVFGKSLLLEYLEKYKVDVLFLFQDSFNIVPMADKILEIKRRKGFKVVAYFPIDTERFPDYFLDFLKCVDEAVVYNDWAKEIVTNKLKGKKDYPCHISVITHGYTPADFYKLEDKEIENFRGSFFAKNVKKDDILIVQSDSNSQRKNFYKTLQVVGRVAQKNPKVKLYVNTKVNDQDFQLFYLASQCGLIPGKNFLYHVVNRGGLTQDTLNHLYNSADIGISCVLGEGCGLFHYEMMSLGKPLLIANNSAHKEAVEYGACMGIDSGTRDDDWIVLPNDLSSERPLINVQDAVTKLERLITGIVHKEDAVEEMKQKALRFMEHRTWQEKGQEWIALFKKVVDTHYEDKAEDVPKALAPVNDKAFLDILKKHIAKASEEYKKKTGKDMPTVSFHTK